MNEPPREAVLLIYQAGTSDLLIDGEGTRRKGSAPVPFRAFVQQASGILAESDRVDLYRRRGIAFPLGLRAWAEGSERVLSFPILSQVLAFIRRSSGGRHLGLVLIVTDQRSRRYRSTDTVGLVNPISLYLSLLAKARIFPSAERLPPGIIRKEPADYDVMTEWFTSLAQSLDPMIDQAKHTYYGVTAGTSAMSFAATAAFGHDARVRFLYQPMPPEAKPGRPEPRPPAAREIVSFLRLPRQRSLNLVDAALANFDFAPAARVLAEPGSGFALRDEGVADALAVLEAFDAWEREAFAEGRERLAAGSGPAAGNLAGHLAVLAADPAPGRGPKALTYLRAKSLDLYLRLVVAAIRADTAAFVDRLMTLLDVNEKVGLTLVDDAVAWRTLKNEHVVPGLLRTSRRFGWRYSERKKELREDETICYVWRGLLADDSEAGSQKRAWLEAFLRLRFLVEPKLREYRNAHQHDPTALERTLLDDFVREETKHEETGGEVAAGAGASAILPFAHDLVAAIPGGDEPRPVAAPAVAVLAEALGLPSALAERHGLTPPDLSRGTLRERVGGGRLPPAGERAGAALRAAIERKFLAKIDAVPDPREWFMQTRDRLVAALGTVTAEEHAERAAAIAKRLAALEPAAEPPPRFVAETRRMRAFGFFKCDHAEIWAADWLLEQAGEEALLLGPREQLLNALNAKEPRKRKEAVETWLTSATPPA